MIKLSICNLFARPLTTLLAHFEAKLIVFLLFCAPLRSRRGAKQQEKIYFAKNERAK